MLGILVFTAAVSFGLIVLFNYPVWQNNRRLRRLKEEATMKEFEKLLKSRGVSV